MQINKNGLEKFSVIQEEATHIYTQKRRKRKQSIWVGVSSSSSFSFLSLYNFLWDHVLNINDVKNFLITRNRINKSSSSFSMTRSYYEDFGLKVSLYNVRSIWLLLIIRSALTRLLSKCVKNASFILINWFDCILFLFTLPKSLYVKNKKNKKLKIPFNYFPDLKLAILIFLYKFINLKKDYFLSLIFSSCNLKLFKKLEAKMKLNTLRFQRASGTLFV